MAKGILTKHDLDKIGEIIDIRIAPLATKEELGLGLNSLEASLKNYMHEGFEAVMTGMDDIVEQMPKKETVDKLVRWARKVSPKVGVEIDL